MTSYNLYFFVWLFSFYFEIHPYCSHGNSLFFFIAKLYIYSNTYIFCDIYIYISQCVYLIPLWMDIFSPVFWAIIKEAAKNIQVHVFEYTNIFITLG